MTALLPRRLWRVLLAGACAAGGACAADGVTITPAVSRLPALPNQTTTINISIDVTSTRPPAPGSPATPCEGDPHFYVSASQGTLSPGSSGSGIAVKQDGSSVDFIVPRDPRGHAGGNVQLTYVTSSAPFPGEVQIKADTQLTLLGQGQSCGLRFQGLGQLYLDRQPGAAPPEAPPAQPPFDPSVNQVNPPTGILNRALGLAGLLTLLGGIHVLSSRPKTGSMTVAAAPAPAPEPPKPPDLKPPDPPTPPPIPKLKRDKKQKVDAESTVEVMVTPDKNEVKGDGTSFVTLTVNVIAAALPSELSSTGVSVDGRISRVTYSADSSGWDFPKKSPSPATAGPKTTDLCTAGWETTDRMVIITATVSVSVTISGATFKDGTTTTPVTKEAHCQVLVRGANPRFELKAPESAQATGSDSVLLSATLFLFGEEAKTEETLSLAHLKTKIGTTDWERDLPPSRRTSWNSAEADWTPPFLIQERDPDGSAPFGDEIDIVVTCSWTQGESYKRATQPGKSIPKDIPVNICHLTLLGCNVSVSPPTQSFIPSVTKKLTPSVKLINSRSDPVKNPFQEPAVCSSNAKVKCEVRDFTQAPPTYFPMSKPDGNLKIPPKLPFDMSVLEEAGAATDQETSSLLLHRVYDNQVANSKGTNRPVEVNGKGELVTPGKQEFAIPYEPLRPGQEPIPGAPFFYTVTVEDGFDGKVEVRGAFCVTLGNLMLETGGPDFRVYEYRPYCFRLQYLPPLADDKAPGCWPAGPVTFRWWFAVVDGAGNPQAFAQTATELCDGLAHDDPVHHFFLGQEPEGYQVKYWPSREKFYFIPPGAGTSPSDPFGGIVSDPQIVNAAESPEGVNIRRSWHALSGSYAVPEAGIPWVTMLDADGNPIPENWTDYAMPMAVRVEMLNDAGHLVATSDRMLTQNFRTPPENVWRDHQFRYVLLALRLCLQDSLGQPYANARYRLAIDGMAPVEASTSANGWIETMIPPGVPEGTLTILHGEGGRETIPGCEFKLKLGRTGDLHSEDQGEQLSAVMTRLNNLGYQGADPRTRDPYDEAAVRAIQRFQKAQKLPISGAANYATIDALEKLEAAKNE